MSKDQPPKYGTRLNKVVITVNLVLYIKVQIHGLIHIYVSRPFFVTDALSFMKL